MKITVIRGVIVYKGKEIKKGSTFECEKGVAEQLINGNAAVEHKTPEVEKEVKKEVEKPKGK